MKTQRWNVEVNSQFTKYVAKRFAKLGFDVWCWKNCDRISVEGKPSLVTLARLTDPIITRILDLVPPSQFPDPRNSTLSYRIYYLENEKLNEEKIYGL